MPTRKDILIWRAVLILTMGNIKAQEMPSVREVSKTELIERISPMVVATLTVAHHLFVRTVAVNVWAAT